MIEFQETCDRCGVVVKHVGALEYDEAAMRFTVVVSRRMICARSVGTRSRCGLEAARIQRINRGPLFSPSLGPGAQALYCSEWSYSVSRKFLLTVGLV